MKRLFPIVFAATAVFALVLRVAQAQSPQPTSPISYKFQFGTGKTAAGYTSVTPDTPYSAERGYGFEPGPAVTAISGDSDDPLDTGAVISTKPFSFSVAAPQEGNYRVTVTLGDPKAESTVTVKSEVRRLMVEHLHTDAGKFVTRTFTVNVRGPKISTGGRVALDSREWDSAKDRAATWSWDDKLTLTFGDAHPALAAIEIHKVDDVPTVFILGDSTVTDQPSGPGGSWGQMFTRWFKPEVAIANHAESGETLKGFLKERRWDKVLDSIKPGDYVLIEFGTNDSKAHGPQNIYPNQDFSETYAPAETTYRELLRKFVADAKKRGAQPVIISPSARQNDVTAQGSLSAYANAAMATAKEIGVPFINLNAMGAKINVALGDEAARQFNDRTHHVEYGAYLQAKCIVEGIKQNQLPLAKYIVDDFGDFDPDHPEPTPAHYTLPPDPAPPRRGPRPAPAQPAP
jgi:lysophospholipase L1-like esterase